MLCLDFFNVFDVANHLNIVQTLIPGIEQIPTLTSKELEGILDSSVQFDLRHLGALRVLVAGRE